MKKVLMLALAAGVSLTAVAPAQAEGGCGRYYHRGPYGRCIRNGSRAVVAAPGIRLVIGNYYHGRGYWDGRRYWQHRYRYHNGWRYR